MRYRFLSPTWVGCQADMGTGRGSVRFGYAALAVILPVLHWLTQPKPTSHLRLLWESSVPKNLVLNRTSSVVLVSCAGPGIEPGPILNLECLAALLTTTPELALLKLDRAIFHLQNNLAKRRNIIIARSEKL